MFSEILLASAISLTTVTIKPNVEFIPVKVEMSAYCPCLECSEGWGRRTVSGVTLSQEKGHIALPRQIPFGTVLDIPDERKYVNVDRGGYIKFSDGVMRVDVFMDKHEDTIKYGRTEKWGYIIKKGE